MKAKVKWWNDEKGYGFVQLENETTQSDIFCHYSAIQGEGFKTLVEGELVTIELLDGPKGPQATKVFREGVN